MFPNNRMTFSVYIEGNLGAGKTTLLEKIESQISPMTMEWVAKTFPEPVAEWEKVGTSQSNLLKLMYDSPKEHSFSFQSHAISTKVKQLKEADFVLNIIERSLASQRDIFIPLLFSSGYLTQLQKDILEHAISVYSKDSIHVPDLIVFLDVEPEVALKRIRERGREAERGVTLHYLKEIRHRYSDWLDLLPPHQVWVLRDEPDPQEFLKELSNRLLPSKHFKDSDSKFYDSLLDGFP